METKIYDMTKDRMDLGELQEAAQIIREGGLLGIPTETVYGLGANALDEHAVERIFLAKGRPQDNPMLIHVPDDTWLEKYCTDIPKIVYTLTKKFWPGPLTLILPRQPIVPNRTTSGMETVGVRCPDNEVTRKIIELAGVPIAAPSANKSGHPSCTCAQEVYEDLHGEIEGIVDNGPCEIGVESTILDVTCTPPRLLRPGGLPLELLEEVLGEVVVDQAVTRSLAKGEQPKAPGMKYRHYAPNAPLTIVTGDGARSARYIREHAKPGDGVICYEEYAKLFPDQIVQSLGKEEDAAEHAQNVFRVLRSFDATDAAQIWGQCPDGEGMDLAVRNRLLKASGFHMIDLTDSND